MDDKQYESIAESMWNTYKGLASFIQEKSVKPQRTSPLAADPTLPSQKGYSKQKRTKLGRTLRRIKQAGERYHAASKRGEDTSTSYGAVEPHITADELRRGAKIKPGTASPEGSLATRVFRGSRDRVGNRRS